MASEKTRYARNERVVSYQLKGGDNELGSGADFVGEPRQGVGGLPSTGLNWDSGRSPWGTDSPFRHKSSLNKMPGGRPSFPFD